MSFEDLQKLKEKIGAKIYNQTVHGVVKKTKQTDYKRANKNRPREVSSKIKPTIKSVRAHSNQAKAIPPRDPRFDPLCGLYDDKTFKANYKFVGELKKKERTELQKEYEECEDERRKHKIKLLIQRLDNQIREQENREKKESIEYEEKLERRDKLKKGEKPIYKKKCKNLCL